MPRPFDILQSSSGLIRTPGQSGTEDQSSHTVSLQERKLFIISACGFVPWGFWSNFFATGNARSITLRASSFVDSMFVTSGCGLPTCVKVLAQSIT